MGSDSASTEHGASNRAERSRCGHSIRVRRTFFFHVRHDVERQRLANVTCDLMNKKKKTGKTYFTYARGDARSSSREDHTTLTTTRRVPVCTSRLVLRSPGDGVFERKHAEDARFTNDSGGNNTEIACGDTARRVPTENRRPCRARTRYTYKRRKRVSSAFFFHTLSAQQRRATGQCSDSEKFSSVPRVMTFVKLF